jgi:Cu-Zn family superoxide dismutase
MSVRPICISFIVAASFALVAGCESWNKDKSRDNKSDDATRMSRDPAKMKTATATIRPSRAAATQPVENSVHGTVTFTQTGSDQMKVMVVLSGLRPNTTHGFHIHEKGDLSDAELMSAGAHFNPAGHKHGGPESAMAHAGDLGNVTADHTGAVRTEMNVKNINLDEGSPNNVVGKSVLVHAKEDDLKTDPSGNAGGRIAGGVIELAK